MDYRKAYDWSHNGTRQSDRFPRELSEDYIGLDERSFTDLIAQTAEYARSVRYFSDDNNLQGHWEEFFSLVYDYENGKVKEDKIHELALSGSIPPHLALLFSFFKMFAVEQKQLNALLTRHKEFYYRDILGFRPKDGSAGKATLLFKLTKPAKEAFVKKGTKFLAGKDAEGKNILYQAVSDVTVNRIALEEKKASTDIQYSDFSISISFPQLLQPDGKISCILITKNETVASILSNCNVEYTGPEGWVEASVIQYEGISRREKMAIRDKVFIEIEKESVHPVPYDPSIHGAGFSGNDPLMRFTPKDNNTFDSFVSLETDTIISVIITVEDTQNFKLKNPDGDMINKKGAYPFGAMGRKDSDFTIVFPFEPSGTPVLDYNVTSVVGAKLLGLNKNNLTYTLETDEYDQRYLSNKYAQTILETINNPNKELGLSEADKERLESFLRSVGNYLKKQDVCKVEVQRQNIDKNLTIIAEIIKNSQEPQEIQDLIAFVPQFSKPVTVTSVTYKCNSIKYFATNPFCTHTVQKDASFFPAFQEKGKYYYLGFSGFRENDTVSLFFEMKHVKEYPSSVSLSWSVLDGDKWSPVSKFDVLKDSTSDLLNSGVIALKPGNSILAPHNCFPENLQWMRLKEDSLDFGAIANIECQVVEVEVCPDSPGKALVGTPLPAGTISKSVSPISGVKTIDQKYPGNEGRYEETLEGFDARVSEELRHKDRAVSPWDYERLVLEAFPSIASAKCIPCCDTSGKFSPGTVTLVVIPTSAANQSDQLSPRAGSQLRAKVQSFIEKKQSPFTTLYVIDPAYKEVKVSCTLKLHPGYDNESYYKNLINQALKEYFSPWITGDAPAEFRSGYNESNVLAFVEDLPWVDYIERFKVSVGGEDLKEGKEIATDNVLNMLTSVSEHDIQFI